MGIQGLTKLLNDNAPDSVKEVKFESYFGRKVAVDASMFIYQFMARSLHPRACPARAADARRTLRRWWGGKARRS